MSANKTISYATLAIIAFILIMGLGNFIFKPSANTIAGIFKIINLLIIAWGAKYLFQKMVVPEIKKIIQKKIIYFKNLENKGLSLIEQNEFAKKEIKDQDKLFEILKDKIALWEQARKKQKELQAKELDIISDHYKQRLEIQKQNLEQKKLIQKVFPKVITNTYKKLEQTFANKEESTKYVGDILNYMKNVSKHSN